MSSEYLVGTYLCIEIECPVSTLGEVSNQLPQDVKTSCLWWPEARSNVVSSLPCTLWRDYYVIRMGNGNSLCARRAREKEIWHYENGILIEILLYKYKLF